MSVTLEVSHLDISDNFCNEICWQNIAIILVILEEFQMDKSGNDDIFTQNAIITSIVVTFEVLHFEIQGKEDKDLQS